MDQNLRILLSMITTRTNIREIAIMNLVIKRSRTILIFFYHCLLRAKANIFLHKLFLLNYSHFEAHLND